MFRKEQMVFHFRGLHVKAEGCLESGKVVERLLSKG